MNLKLKRYIISYNCIMLDYLMDFNLNNLSWIRYYCISCNKDIYILYMYSYRSMNDTNPFFCYIFNTLNELNDFIKSKMYLTIEPHLVSKTGYELRCSCSHVIVEKEVLYEPNNRKIFYESIFNDTNKQVIIDNLNKYVICFDYINGKYIMVKSYNSIPNKYQIHGSGIICNQYDINMLSKKRVYVIKHKLDKLINRYNILFNHFNCNPKYNIMKYYPYIKILYIINKATKYINPNVMRYIIISYMFV
jgi:hypothetical protein